MHMPAASSEGILSSNFVSLPLFTSLVFLPHGLFLWLLAAQETEPTGKVAFEVVDMRQSP